MRYLLSEIAAISGGRFSGVDRPVGRVVTDSRSETGRRERGDALFVAIRTRSRDGAAYVGELYAREVRGFVVGEDFAGAADFPEAGFIAVTDTVAALQALAAHYRTGFRGKVVGITGSCGKTTLKEWISQLAPAGVSLFRSPKSWNSQIGVALSLLMARGDEDYVVIEAGISEPGEMAALQRMIRPDIAILTSVGGAHAENFASHQQLLREKMVLLRDCPVVMGVDGGEGAESRGEKVTGLQGDELAGAEESRVTALQGGDFARRNAALAAAFWRHEGYDIPDSAIENLEPVAMRLEVREGLFGSVIINDTYNSDINSLGIALDYLARVAGSRPRTLVMADMVAATGAGGADEDAYRRAAAMVKASGVEHFVGIGPALTAHAGLFGAESSFYDTADDFVRSLTSAGLQGGAILIKGGARRGFERISHALESRSHTTALEVDLDAIIHNLHLCRSRLAPGVGVMPMIKASAYGHGIFEVARVLQQQGVDYLAVAFADEGVALREAGITMPIVVLNADEGSFEVMIRHRLEPEIYNFTSLDRFTRLLKRHGEHRYPIHIKFDTGMHRLGFGETDIQHLAAELAAEARYVHVATIFSHLAAADDPAEDGFSQRQISDFDRASSALAATLPYPVKRHLANTSGAERLPGSHFDIVRLGIGLYGIGFGGARPAASLKTRIVNIAELPAGESVGYGRRGVLSRPSRIATIPIGYADGLDRRLSNGAWSVLVDGHPAPIVGNVCMDSCMIDVTDIPGAAEGGEAVIFSPAPGNTVCDMAAALGTIPYEVMTSVSTRVKRIYIKE